MTEPTPQTAHCHCGAVTVTFDEEAAKNLSLA